MAHYATNSTTSSAGCIWCALRMATDSGSSMALNRRLTTTVCATCSTTTSVPPSPPFWEQTFEMLETQHLDIIAHFDKIKMHNRDRFFTENEQWYKILADKAIQLIKRYDVIIEVNTRGLYKKRCERFYPSTELLMKARKAEHSGIG